QPAGAALQVRGWPATCRPRHSAVPAAARAPCKQGRSHFGRCFACPAPICPDRTWCPGLARIGSSFPS
ncbi:unnamed protein product, partial [Bubo scandiacus]